MEIVPAGNTYSPLLGTPSPQVALALWTLIETTAATSIRVVKLNIVANYVLKGSRYNW
jgi:hypothetical protein